MHDAQVRYEDNIKILFRYYFVFFRYLNENENVEITYEYDTIFLLYSTLLYTANHICDEVEVHVCGVSEDVQM